MLRGRLVVVRCAQLTAQNGRQKSNAFPFSTASVHSGGRVRGLREVLEEVIPQQQTLVTAFRKQYGSEKIGDVTVDMGGGELEKGSRRGVSGPVEVSKNWQLLWDNQYLRPSVAGEETGSRSAAASRRPHAAISEGGSCQMSAEDDFLERIFLAEQTYYSEAYRAGFDLSSKDIPRSDSESTPLDRQPELDAAWARGVQHGAELGSELYSYLGLANRVLSTNTATTTAGGRSERHVELARTLLVLLTQSPGLLQFPCAELVKRPDFEGEMARIRAKARQLLSLLGVNTISRKMDGLSF
nr:unnamed protein product [Spirometra erinaceieuropaei]